jgi:hypothetical protein
MSISRATLRSIQAAHRKQEREAQRRRRDLERQAKEQAKLSALEQARLEVEMYENRLDVLLSIHKQQGEILDWSLIEASLPPPRPSRACHHELRTKLQLITSPAPNPEEHSTALQSACLLDEMAFQAEEQAYLEALSQWTDMKDLARRIRRGDPKAYTEAMTELSPLAELSDLGSSMHFTVHNLDLIICEVDLNGVSAIPPETKSLTSSGKLSVKTMPRGRFHGLYQDYVCGCVLRVCREVFALLPANLVLITAFVDWVDSSTGGSSRQPILSVALPRDQVSSLDFEALDPSDSVENFLHRGDFKASRKAEAFQPITPLTPGDLQNGLISDVSFPRLHARAKGLREELKMRMPDIAQRVPPV